MRRWFILCGLASGFMIATAVAADPPAPSGIAATVNGEAIRLEQVDAFIKKKLAVTPVTNAELRLLRLEVVADMIDDLLLKQFLAKNGAPVDPAEIDRYLKAFTESLAKQGKTFAEFLRDTNQTKAEVRESWAAMLQLSGYVKKTATEKQLRQYYAANKDYFDR